MKCVSLFLLVAISGSAVAGSLGKYQHERVDVPITIAPLGKSPQLNQNIPNLRKSLKQTQIKQVKRSFYGNFTERVQQLSDEDKQIWRKRFKNNLQLALGESPIDVGKINHYSKLVNILQSQQGG